MSALALKKTGIPVLDQPISHDEQAEVLRNEIIAQWSLFQEAVEGGHKDYLQALHRTAKGKTNEVSACHIQKLLEKRKSFFRAGSLINPAKIRPKLIFVQPRTVWEDLFKICRAYWSMPYSKGYGRRLRFVIFDEEHEAVMGIIGLQSPPADLACRDKLFDYPDGQKLEFVNCTLDAYTIGAIPPYSNLLGGKLIASLVASDDIRKAYWRMYANKITILDKKILSQPLLAVTTTSAFGRSSIYNRLCFDGRLLAEPIGWTKGFGTVHLELIYPRIESWLQQRNVVVAGGFGNGPKVRWQNITNALKLLQLPAKYAEHGVKREVFIFRHVENIENVCKKGDIPIPIKCETEKLISHWLERWALPRSQRDPSWRYSLPIPLISAGIKELG